MKTLYLSIVFFFVCILSMLMIQPAHAQNDPTLLYGSKPKTPTDTAEQLHKKLINAKDAISIMMGSKMLKIPISTVGVDEQNLTLDVGMRDPNATIPSVAEKYKNKVQEIIGDLPIHIDYENPVAYGEILTQNMSQSCCDKPVTIVLESPLKQFLSGTLVHDVKCGQGFQLVIKSENDSPACVKPDTAGILVKRGWTHDNTILPKNLSHIVTPFLNGTNTEKPKVTNEHHAFSMLRLFLSVDSMYANPAETVGINISLNNTGSTPLTLTKSNNWIRDDLSSGPCSNLPLGMAILKGYYTEQNMTGVSSLVIYQNIPCPSSQQIKSYAFQPLSTKATQECDTLFSCTGLVDMKTHLEINGFIDNNGQHQPFKVGTYTIIAGDEWGDVSIQHFTEEFATAYSNTIGN